MSGWNIGGLHDRAFRRKSCVSSAFALRSARCESGRGELRPRAFGAPERDVLPFGATRMMSDRETAPVRVFVADDHPLTLDGIKAAVSADDRLQIVGEAGDGPTALRRAIDLRPDVAVLDLSMPGLDGIELARKLLASCPECRVLMLSVQEDIAALRHLLDLGISGYVLKTSASGELCRCVHAVAGGGVYLDPAIAGQLVRGGRRKMTMPEILDESADLSTREVEVLRLAALGHSNKTIAARLHIGPKSVETYKARAMGKLGFTNRVDLVRFAMAEGWLGEPSA
jgi:DNA-binding NarL/FixJ family response regulator